MDPRGSDDEHVAFKMSYQAPHLRSRTKAQAPEPKVNLTSVAEFPTLGHVPVQMARTIHETSLAARAAAWNEASQPKTDQILQKKKDRALDDAKIALRGFYAISMRQRAPTPYKYAHEVEQDYLDELEAEQAMEAGEEIPTDENVNAWTAVERTGGGKETKTRQKSPPRSELDQERIRERITFLNKKLRRNDLQNRNNLTREAYEKELRELYARLSDEDQT